MLGLDLFLKYVHQCDWDLACTEWGKYLEDYIMSPGNEGKKYQLLK